mgnify:CR=1 FL=1
MLKVELSPVLGLKLITPSTMHEDYRGKYTEIYNRDEFHEAGITLHGIWFHRIVFVQIKGMNVLET